MLSNQYTECNRKWNTNFIEIENEKNRIFVRSKYLGLDITWNGEKPWATKDIFINYVLIRNDSVLTIVRFTCSCHQLCLHITQFNSVPFTSTENRRTRSFSSIDSFSSNLTRRSFTIQSLDNLSCKGLFRVKMLSLLLRPGSDNSISLWCKLRHTLAKIDFVRFRSRSSIGSATPLIYPQLQILISFLGQLFRLT